MKKITLIAFALLVTLAVSGQRIINDSLRVESNSYLKGNLKLLSSKTFTLGNSSLTTSKFITPAIRVSDSLYIGLNSYIGYYSPSGLHANSRIRPANGSMTFTFTTDAGAGGTLYVGYSSSKWHIGVAENNVWDLGSSSERFKDGYFSGVAYAGKAQFGKGVVNKIMIDSTTITFSGKDTTGLGSTANVGKMLYYNGHFYGLKAGAPPTWIQLDN